jgi:hypothetical protein
MVFVLLAHVRYNEITLKPPASGEAGRLAETERKLMIEYEKAFDIIAVEQYATNVLGHVQARREPNKRCSDNGA